MDDKEKLSNPQVTIQTIQKYGFQFQKRYGQNFLIDGHVIGKILRAADISGEDTVVEIGPGIGTLTQYLAEAAGKVYAVEIDEKLLPILADTLSSYDNVEVIHQDILKCDLTALLGEGKTCKIVANLPYYITTPIIMGLLEGHVPAESITVMVQKEVAERMAAAPGSKIYGALSLAVQYYADTYLAANVPPNCFMPRPAVGSAVIRLTRREKPPVDVQDEAWMFRLIRASFNERRKTLVNGLRNEPSLGITKEEAEEALTGMGLSPTVRGETLSLEQFAELSDRLRK
jgi:16S rRNA (adenine1518-N6/adenine1519-N6)-dimethyltransferase